MSASRSWFVMVAGSVVVVLGLVAGPTRASQSLATGRPGRHATARPLLGGESRNHPESAAEMFAAAAHLNAAHAGSLAGDSLAAANLAAFRAAQAMPAALNGTFAHPWHEAGPRPYHVDDPRYGHACSLDCLQPHALEQPLSDLGWDRVAGRMTAIAIDPNDKSANRVWAGSAGGGVWYSSDAGAHWTPKFDQQPTLPIGAIAVDPKNSPTVFVGTGEANTAFENFYGSGVYRTRDGGASWQRVAQNVPPAATVFRIEIAGGRIFVATNKGLFRSTNGGDSYESVKLPTNADGTAPATGPFGNFVTDVKIKPDNANEITAVVGWRNGKHYCPDGPLCSPGNGLYRSTTGGAPGSFARMQPSGFGTPGRSKDPVGRVTLAYATGAGEDHNIMWALIQDAGRQSGDIYVDFPASVTNVNSFNGVYRSGDDGRTWELKATSETLNAAQGSGLTTGVGALYYPGVQSWYNQWIAVDPTNADNVLLGLEEIYQTTANANGAGLAAFKTVGRYWNYCLLLAAGPELPMCDKLGLYGGHFTTHPDQHASAMAATPNGVRLYAGNDGGVYRQDSSGSGFTNEGWTSVNDTLGTTQPYYAVIANDGTIYAGFQDNGTAKISPDGRADMVYGGDGFDVAVDPTNANIAYEEYVGGTISKTLDGGMSWISIAPTLTAAQFSTPFEMDPMNSDHLVLPANEIAETTKGADTKCDGDVLSQANAHIPQLCDWVFSYAMGGSWQSSGVDVRGADVYVGICGVCDIITQSSGDPNAFHNGIATNVQGGCTPATGTDACWHIVQDPKGLPARYISDVAMDPADRKTIYVAMAGYGRRWYPPNAANPKVGRGHVFVSHDAGQTFTDVSTNLPDSPANAIAVRGGSLIVGTDVGVFAGSKTGGAWARLGSGLPNVPVFDVNLNAKGTKLVIATHGRGVWTYDFGAAPAAAHKTNVLGKHTTRTNLPATGSDETVALGVAILLSAVLLRRRSRA